MNQENLAHTADPAAEARTSAPWLWLSSLAGLLAIAASLVGLSDERIYAALTPAFYPQAIAQDIANLVLASPALLFLAALARRGSRRAHLLWLGVLTFTIYNYVIYAFAVPFGPLFLPWVAVLGLSLYALIGGLATVNHRAVAAAYTSRRAVVVTAWILLVTALLFAILWLSEDLPALLAGTRPQSLVDLDLPTNPVHILDLGFFLPAVVITGVLLLRRQPLAHTLAPGFIVFLILTGVPILITPAVQAARGQPAGWGVLAPIGTLSLLLLALLTWLMTTIRSGLSGGGFRPG
jgi:hypothetical protein